MIARTHPQVISGSDQLHWKFRQDSLIRHIAGNNRDAWCRKNKIDMAGIASTSFDDRRIVRVRSGNACAYGLRPNLGILLI